MSELPPLKPFSRTFEPGRQWKHVSGALYRLIGQGRLEWNLGEVVIYQAEKDGSLWVRPSPEFISRFQLVEAPVSPTIDTNAS